MISKILSEPLKAQIEKEAAEYAGQFKHGGDYRRWGYMDGAAPYALKLQQAEEMMEKMRLALTMTVFALKQSYDVTEWPANGETEQDSGIKIGEQALTDYHTYKQTKDGTANG